MCEALCSQKDAFAMRIFAQAGVKDLKLVISKTRDFIAGQPQVSGAAQQVLGRFLESLVDDARAISSGMSDEFVAVEHLVLALARDERFGKGLMADLGITYANLEAAVITLRRGENVTDQDAEDKYEALKKYSRDLTEEARAGKLDPVIGRDDEIRRTIQILKSSLEEQSGVDRRTRGREDGGGGGTGATRRSRRRPDVSPRRENHVVGHGFAHRRAPSFEGSLKTGSRR